MLRLTRHHNPLIDPALFKIRAFRGSSIVALTFSIAFGAMLLSIVLWMQDVWRWSALQTGLAFAPGPLMVPLFGFLLHRAADRALRPGPRDRRRRDDLRGRGRLVGAARRVSNPNYLGQVLPGTICTGIGVGLTLPTFMATGASALPPHSFATGSGVVNMLRQVGLAIGVSVFVAVVGSPATPEAALNAFQQGWTVIAAIGFLAAIVGAVALREHPAATATRAGPRPGRSRPTDPSRSGALCRRLC